MRLRCLRAEFAVVALGFVLVGCALLFPEAPPPKAHAAPEEFPETYYRDILAQGGSVYRVDPSASLVVIEVRRSGSLARLGHDHVVASHVVEGYVAPGEGRADLYVQLAKLTVDEPALRSSAGFDTQPSQSDIGGTRANMLEKVLEADKFPFALIRVDGADGSQTSAVLGVTITLHGVTRRFEVPATIDADVEGTGASGRLSFDQTDFEITPYSLLGGAIAVRNRVDLRFRIRARRI